MLRKKSRLSKIMAVVLLFMMVFSFNTAFGQQVVEGNEQGGNPGQRLVSRALLIDDE